MKLAQYSFSGFFIPANNIGSNAIFSPIPCIYSIDQYGEELDIVVRETLSGGYRECTLLYIGENIPSLAKRIQIQFMQVYDVIVDENSIKQLLRAIHFL